MDKAIIPSKVEGASVLSAADREELSSICLEVMTQALSIALVLFFYLNLPCLNSSIFVVGVVMGSVQVF